MAHPILRIGVRAAIGLTVVGGLAVAGVVGAGRYYEHSQREDLNAQLESLMTYAPPTTVEVLDVHGEVYDSFGVERRYWVPIAEMPEAMSQAVIAAEDRRFRTHSGVDPLGILRAFKTNVQKGNISEGGSTLTQQMVKQLVVGDEKSYERKIQEALLARRLERTRTKDQILELYLNHTYFGSGNYGVEAASRDYFGKSVRDITVDEAALLAAMIPAPSRYSPRRNLESATRQRNRVIEDLVEVGILDRTQYTELVQRPIAPPRRQPTARRAVGNAYRTHVRREVRDRFPTHGTRLAGARVSTPYDPRIQAVAERAVEQTVADVIERQGPIELSGQLATRAEWADFNITGRGMRLNIDGRPMEPQVGDCFDAAVVRPWAALHAGPHRVELPKEEWQLRLRRGSSSDYAGIVGGAQRGNLLPVCITADGPRLARHRWADGAAVVIDNTTGGIVAMTGGIDMQLEGFNKATQAKRQPGSTFKPYVYGAALELGGSQLDRVLDGPITIGRWSPKNAGGYHGMVDMRFALAQSLNTVAVRLIHRVGANRVKDFARRAGVRSPLRSDLTLALGSSEVTVLDQATGFATLARLGQHTEPYVIESVSDLSGGLLGRAGDALELPTGTIALAGPDKTQMIPERVAAQLVDMMTGTIKRGTGRRAYEPGWARAGKTGTTSDNVDGWFVGMTPDHTIAVWVGSNTRTPLGKGEYGGRAALPAWVAISDALGKPAHDFVVPPSVQLVPERGELAVVPRVTDPSAPMPGFLAEFPVGPQR